MTPTTNVYPLSFLRHLEEKYCINLDREFSVYCEDNKIANIKDQKERMIAIMKSSCSYAQIRYEDLIGKNRKVEVVLLRKILMENFYKSFPISLTEIGLMFGGRDHSTVSHARDTAEDLRDSKDKLFTYYYDMIQPILEGHNLLKQNV